MDSAAARVQSAGRPGSDPYAARSACKESCTTHLQAKNCIFQQAKPGRPLTGAVQREANHRIGSICGSLALVRGVAYGRCREKVGLRQISDGFSSRFRKPLFGFSAFALLVAVFAFAKFTIHILTGQNYGYFGDEFYAIAASKHLAFGYVDLPPLTPFLIAISRALFGESLLAYHIFPALAGSATLVFVCLITREFGGRLFATALSALGFIAAPMWLITNSFFCYDGFNQLALAVFLYLLVRYLRTEDKKLWIDIGLAAGIAFMTKATILISAPGILIALLATKHRKDLLTPWPWIAVGLFALVISPWVMWEVANHWPTLEYWSGHTRWFYHYSIPEYFINISLNMNPLLMPLLGVGLYRIFRRFGDTYYSFLGVVFLVTMVIVYLLHARVFELIHLFVPLLSAGAVFVEEKLAHMKLRRAFGIIGVSYLLAGGALVAPASLPILSLDQLPAYSGAFGFLFKPVKDYTIPKPPYPWHFAMRIGWEKLVSKVAEVYAGLPPGDREEAVIWTLAFNEAGAIDLYGPRYGLPHAVSGHLQYYLWGPGEKSWDVVVAVTADLSRIASSYWEVEKKAYVGNLFWPYGDYICVCRLRQNQMSKETIWARLKEW
jgi:hypothetical protein